MKVQSLLRASNHQLRNLGRAQIPLISRISRHQGGVKFSSQKGIQGGRTREIGAQAWYFCSMATNQQGFDAGKAALEQNLGILEEEMVSELRNEDLLVYAG
jgi:hypothetical protein